MFIHCRAPPGLLSIHLSDYVKILISIFKYNIYLFSISW